MAKELPYFKFYLNDWLTGNITIQDMATQGVFVNVCVLFWSRDCDLTYQNCLERFKKKERKLIENLVKVGIIKIENEKIRIVFLEKQLENQNILSKTNQKNVKKRYETPADATNFSTTVDALVYNIDKIRGDEIRGDEITIKEKELIDVFFNDLENCSEIERIAINQKKTKEEIKKFISGFKLKADLSYPTWERFINHFKNFVNTEINSKKIYDSNKKNYTISPQPGGFGQL